VKVRCNLFTKQQACAINRRASFSRGAREGHKDKTGHHWVALGVSRNSEICDRTKLGLVKDKREARGGCDVVHEAAKKSLVHEPLEMWGLGSKH